MEELNIHPLMNVVIKDEPMDTYEIYEFEISKVKEEIEEIVDIIKTEEINIAEIKTEEQSAATAILSEHNYCKPFVDMRNETQIQTDEDGIEYEEVDLNGNMDAKPKLKCPQCPIFLEDLFELNRHLTLHTVDLMCRYCMKIFKRRPTFEIHQCDMYRPHHNINLYQNCDINTIFKCCYCDKKFLRKQQLMDHEQLHKNPNQFYCTKCDKRFRSKYCLANHNKVIHSEKRMQEQKEQEERLKSGVHREGWIKCQLCPLLFKNADSRNKHCDQAHGYSLRRRIANRNL